MDELNERTNDAAPDEVTSRARAAIEAIAARANLRVRVDPADADARTFGALARVDLGPRTFLLVARAAADAAAIAGAIARFRAWRAPRPEVSLLLCVPFMGDVGRRECELARVPWFDWSGNAEIVGDGVYVSAQGRKNANPRPERVRSAFGPGASRIARCLLIDHPKPIAQTELKSRTGLAKGFVSDTLSRLEDAALIARNLLNEVTVPDPKRLFTAWAREYRFDAHRRIAGTIVSTSGLETLHRTVTTIGTRSGRIAATGLAGAWLLRPFAQFRLATIYVEQPPSQALLRELEFVEEPRGANLWLIVPRDPGVFTGSAERHGVPCAHPVQVLLDLAGHPERANDARMELERDVVERWGAS